MEAYNTNHGQHDKEKAKKCEVEISFEKPNTNVCRENFFYDLFSMVFVETAPDYETIFKTRFFGYYNIFI